MKLKALALVAVTFLMSCQDKAPKKDDATLKLNGTWQLISGTTITKGVSEVTDYTKNQRMIKIVNDTHFAFLRHSLAAKDTANIYDAGGGSYTLMGDKYTEHLDYYKDKNWENKTFDFTVTIKNDTLTQRGIEKIEKSNIDREIIEKYVRVKN